MGAAAELAGAHFVWVLEGSSSEHPIFAAWLAATRRVGEPPVATNASPAAAKRLAAFLQRRGFSYRNIRSVLRELLAETEDDGKNSIGSQISCSW